MKNELSVDVSVNICVDKKTAEKCLRLVELYLDGHKVFTNTTECFCVNLLMRFTPLTGTVTGGT